ncbi:hypothetical protein CIPAW_12G038100 [Carya illinoinensis]|uniref:Uncharacterized protein n=1 Tax=Carya illinoinensis TaxID=32201 RepID=A0A8T1NUH4_CARIL|nr:hypothetical protein CIPAW_12G038100 [Carya illinoinensis]
MSLNIEIKEEMGFGWTKSLRDKQKLSRRKTLNDSIMFPNQDQANHSKEPTFQNKSTNQRAHQQRRRKELYHKRGLPHEEEETNQTAHQRPPEDDPHEDL